MKKLLLIGALAFTAFAAQAQLLIVTNLPANINKVHLLSTNRASVYAIEVTGGTGNGSLYFYDCDSLADPYFGTNYVNAAYVTRTTYPTNYVTSMIGTTGFTNWYTNAGVWTLNVTNAANTNQLPVLLAAPFSANSVSTYFVDSLFVRGITCLSTTNANIVIYYRKGS